MNILINESQRNLQWQRCGNSACYFSGIPCRIFFYNSLLVFKITCSLILHVFHKPAFQPLQPCPCFILQKPPVKRSRSLSPKSFLKDSEELRKLRIAEGKIENLEKTLQLKVKMKTRNFFPWHQQTYNKICAIYGTLQYLLKLKMKQVKDMFYYVHKGISVFFVYIFSLCVKFCHCKKSSPGDVLINNCRIQICANIFVCS